MDNVHYNYIGNGAYCYANSTAMLLDSIGENISPSLIEILTGTSLGLKLNKKDNLMRFNTPALFPDLGLTEALNILGFRSETKVSDRKEDFPIEELQKDLEKGPAVLGPLDMGYLSYNPRHKYLKGADHFVLGYKIENDRLYLHDPENFPNVFIDLDKLRKTWQAEGISYKKGFYRYIINPKRVENPKEDDIFKRAVKFFKGNYIRSDNYETYERFELGGEALLRYAKQVGKNGLSEKEVNWYIYFALPLGAKRANDYAVYFKKFDSALAELKFEQSKLFGKLHCFAMIRDWKSLAKGFEEFAEVEEKFRNRLLEM